MKKSEKYSLQKDVTIRFPVRAFLCKTRK